MRLVYLKGVKVAEKRGRARGCREERETRVKECAGVHLLFVPFIHSYTETAQAQRLSVREVKEREVSLRLPLLLTPRDCLLFLSLSLSFSRLTRHDKGRESREGCVCCWKNCVKRKEESVK